MGRHLINNERGQTSLEYLLLMAMVFITGYLTITGPMGDMATYFVNDIRNRLGNMVRNGEMTANGDVVFTGSAGHPMDARRMRRLHL